MRRSATIGVLVALVAAVIGSIPLSVAAAPLTVPGIPTHVVARPGTLSASVIWQAPSSGGAVSTYTATSNPGAVSATVAGTALSAIVTGLSYGVAYTFTVVAANDLGRGLPSAASNSTKADPPGSQYHQAPQLQLFNRDVTAGSPASASFGEDPASFPGLTAVVLNVTASQATTDTSVQLMVNNQPVDTISLPAGQVESSLAVVAMPATLSQTGVQVTVGRAHVEIDFVGYYTGPRLFHDHGGMLRTLLPAVLFDGPVAANSTTTIPVLGQAGIPASNVAAVLLNVTASAGTGAGSLSVLASNAWDLGTVSVGFAANQTSSNRVISGLGGDGAIKLLDRASPAHALIEVVGWFTSAADANAAGSFYSPIASARLVNSVALSTGLPLTFQVAGQGGTPSSGATAPATSVLLQITVSGSSTAGSVSVYPSTLASGPAAVYFGAGQTVSEQVVAALAIDGSVTIAISGGTANVTVDVLGYFSGDQIVPSTTKKLSPALLAGITLLAPSSITFGAGVQASPPILVNDVINAGASPTTPDGFLRRVLGISHLPTGETVLSTRQATLSEALTSFSISWVLPRSVPLFSFHAGTMGLAPKATLPPFKPPVGSSIDPHSGWPVLTIYGNGHSAILPVSAGALQGEIDINDLELQLVVQGEFAGNPFVNPSFAVGLSLGAKIAADLALRGQVAGVTFTAFDVTHKFALNCICGGAIDIIYRPVIEFKVTLDATLSGGVQYSFNLDKYGLITGGYDNGNFFGNFKGVDYIAPGKAIGNLKPSLQAELRLGVHIIPGVEFYGFATIGADQNPYLRFTVDPFANPWWSFALGLCKNIVMKIDIIILQRQGSINLGCEEVLLAAAPGGKLNIVITPALVAVGRGKLQHFSAAIVGPNFSAHGVIWSIKEAGGGTLSNIGILDVDYTAPLVPGSYTLVAAAVDDSTSTTEASINVNADVPAPPTSVTAAVAGPDSATVSWTAPSADGGAPITAYHVLVSPGGAQIDTGNTLSVTVPGLTTGGTYTFQVTATNKAGTSAPSLASAPITIGAGAPGPPTAVTAVPVIVTTAQGSAVVSWTAPTLDGGSPITAYHVLVSLAGGQVDIGLGIDAGNTLSVTVPNLNAGSTYTFQVTASSQAGTSAPSVASAPITIPIPDIVIVTPANFDYGLVPAGQTSVHTFTLHASSTADITISSMLLLSARAADFTVQADHCTGQVVLASGTCTFDVLYTSRTQGYSWTQVLVYYANATNPLLVVSAFVRGHSPLPLVSNFEPVSGAQMLDLQHGWAMDLHGLLATVDGGKTWTRQLAPAGTKFTGNFRFADAGHGMAFGCVLATFCNDTNILGTSDGGTTWTLLGTIPTLEGRGISLADASHAWVAGAQDGFAGPPLWATIDGGLTWNRQVLPDPTQTTCATVGGLVSSEVEAVRFIDPLHGWAMGSSECQQSGTLAVLSQMTIAWSTSDGGATWTAHDTGLNTFFVFASWRLQVLSATQMRVLVTGTATTVLLTTNDGGATFSQLPLPGPPTDLSFWDANNAVLITDNGRIAWTSSDGGLTWTTAPAAPARYVPTLNNDPALYRLVEAVDASHWWAFGQVVYLDGDPVRGVIEATADTGSSWLAQLIGALN